MTIAVLAIDVQQGLCEGEGSAHDCAGVIESINQVTCKARAAGVPVIFIQHEEPDGDLRYGTPAWQMANGPHALPEDLRVRKTTPDAFLHTELRPLLEARGVSSVVTCGMHTEYCVDTTTRRARALGYPVVLVSDAHTSAGNSAIGPEQVIAHHNASLTNISSFGPRAQAISCSDLEFASLTY